MLAVPGAASAIAALPAYYPSGPQINVDENQLVGWRQCWTGLYGDATSVITTVLAGCPGKYMLLAGGPVAGTVFDVVAAAPRSDVLTDTGTSNTPHNANGTGWYFSNSWSWGFAKQGDPIDRNECDINNTNAAYRLCWHTLGMDEITGGYRSGANTNLNDSTTYRRAIYVPDYPTELSLRARSPVARGTRVAVRGRLSSTPADRENCSASKRLVVRVGSRTRHTRTGPSGAYVFRILVRHRTRVRVSFRGNDFCLASKAQKVIRVL